MEQTKFINLPVIGRIQHGEKVEGKGAKELGYFIAKIQDTYMQDYLKKFDEQYKGKQNIEIEIFSEEPLSIKYVRYNQGGKACSCMENSDTATQKVKNGWQKINCDKYNCQHRQKNEQGKCACNRIAWLKFFIPKLSKDRIFLMRITGQTSIDRLKDYFNLQKMQGNSIKGIYTLYLKQEEQSNFQGKTFNNYNLDILKNEHFISENIPQPTNEKPKENDNNVNSEVITNDTNKKDTNNTEDTEKKSNVKNTTKKQTTNAKKETEKKPKENKQPKDTTNVEDTNNYYSLLKTFKQKLTDKSGNNKEYLVGEFVDSKDKIVNIVIRPEDAEELEKCDLGTFVKLDITERAGKKFAMKLEYISKTQKKLVA